MIRLSTNYRNRGNEFLSDFERVQSAGEVAIRRSQAPEGWAITGSHNGHRIIRCTAVRQDGERCTKDCRFSLHPPPRSHKFEQKQNRIQSLLTDAFALRPHGSDESGLRTEISRLFARLNVPLDSGERPGGNESLD
jgi:hypothetical protein